jgi:protein-tyrosine phosphatase
VKFSLPIDRFTANEVFPNLWVGSAPPTGDYLTKYLFTSLVLCAVEYQPSVREFVGVEVYRAPFRDDASRLTAKDMQIAQKAALWTVEQVRMRRQTLVTCMAGINRSAFVAALAITRLANFSGSEAMAVVRRRREGALDNPLFASILDDIEPQEF